MVDLEGWVARRKARVWADTPIHFIAPSAWMAQRLGESGFAPRGEPSIIPNTLDTGVFAPSDRMSARRAFGIPDGPVVLFGAVGGDTDPVKGGDFLGPVLAALGAAGHAPTLAVFGGPAPADLPGRVVELGLLSGDAQLALAYCAADVFLCPSRIESFSNTCIEAQCCDVPAVGFSSAGQVDAIGNDARLAPPV